MAQAYARTIPDYARLDPALLRHDVAVVSYEYLRVLVRGGEEALEEVAFGVGQRRKRQGVSLQGLLRAYRLWARYALEALKDQAQDLLPLSPRVGEILDRVSEASAQAYELEDWAWSARQGPVVGVEALAKDAAALALAPRHLHLGREQMAYAQSPLGPLLFLWGEPQGVAPTLKALARAHGATLWFASGHPLEEVRKELEEALALSCPLTLPPGLYPTRYLWPLAMALESRRTQEKLLSLLRPLEDHPELLETLAAYLEARLSLKGAARRLGLHPNTVLYRLHRAETLSGLRLDRVEDLSLLQIALQLRTALRGPGKEG